MTLEGRWDAALAALGAANTRDRRASAAIRTERGRVLMDRSFFHRRDPAPARAALEEGRRLANAAGDDATAAAADQGLGQLDYNDAFETKDWKKPRAAFEDVLAARQKVGDRRGVAETLFYLGLTYEQDGQPGPAFERYEKSLAISEEVEDLVQQSYARRHMAGIQEEREELSAAEKNIAAEIELRRRGGFAVGVPFALLQQVDFLSAHGGGAKEADRLLDEAVSLAGKCGSTRALFAAQAEQSRRAAAAGDSQRAFKLAERALEAARAYGGASEIREAQALVGDAGRRLPN
jgi:tetratricopeptide (TPR) repeat protein